MTIHEWSRETLEAAGTALVDAGPVYMVNLLRYREAAAYDASGDMPKCSGREAYFQHYAPAFNRVAQGEDYTLFWVGNVRGVLIGTEGETWDDMVIVRYASFAALQRILESPSYEEQAAPHRRAALADWKFIVTTQPELPR